MDKNFQQAKKWADKAKSDLLDADNNLAAVQIPFDTVCFHCQQAAEKLLKGFLVAKGCDYPITHNLFVILDRVVEIDPKSELLRQTLAVLNPYSVEIRYPGDELSLTVEQAKEARQAAQEVFEWVKNSIPQLFE